MKQFTALFTALFLSLSISIFAQKTQPQPISMNQLIDIKKAEDELRFDKMLVDFLSDKNPSIRERAALAAGRIGSDEAIPTLVKLLANDTDEVRQAAAFALGEIESIKGASAILAVLTDTKNADKVRVSAIEAAGKIAAANEKSVEAKTLGEVILDNLELENKDQTKQSEDVILLGITAVVRAKPAGAEIALAKFLGYSNWRIRADALNTLARLRVKNVNKEARELLAKDENPVVRANAARVLGTADDKSAIDLLLNAASTDQDSRVRVSAIRALSSFQPENTEDKILDRSDVLTRNKYIAEKLLTRSEQLFAEYKKSKFDNPTEENELLTLVSTLGAILKGTDNERAVKFLQEFREKENYASPELGIALINISQKTYIRTKYPKDIDWKGLSGYAQALGELPDLKENRPKRIMNTAEMLLRGEITDVIYGNGKPNKSFPDFLTAYAKFQDKDFQIALLKLLDQDDVIVRSTAANLLGDIKPESSEQSMEIYKALSNALYEARTDKFNDASLAILDGLKKQYENRPPQKVKFPYFTPFIAAIESPDYLIRRKAAEIYRSFNILKPDPMTVGDPSFKPYEIPKDFGRVKFEGDAKDGAKSRVVRADYKKALSRKNGEWAAILKTDKGEFTIDFYPEDAPLTVDNFINLAQKGYFNGLEIHRVVPNFVMQDGDPRGDGNGGPGWQIRDEINQLQFERGTVGMALSGKDTGGSQWFVCHSPQPHLDGGYTVFGKVNETGMKIVDNLVRGDKILNVKIVKSVANK